MFKALHAYNKYHWCEWKLEMLKTVNLCRAINLGQYMHMLQWWNWWWQWHLLVFQMKSNLFIWMSPNLQHHELSGKLVVNFYRKFLPLVYMYIDEILDFHLSSLLNWFSLELASKQTCSTTLTSENLKFHPKKLLLCIPIFTSHVFHLGQSIGINDSFIVIKQE